jgi:uncharacterized protein (TIGR02246 family)
MRKVLFLALMFVSSAAPATQADDEAAIRKIIDSQVAAWNSGDSKAFSRHVSKSVAFTNVFGVVSYGAANFDKRTHATLVTYYKGTTRVMTVRQLRFATPDVAIVDIGNEIHGVKSMPAGIVVPPDGVVRTQLMEVFVRHDRQWWVEAFHNVDVKPSAASTQK